MVSQRPSNWRPKRCNLAIQHTDDWTRYIDAVLYCLWWSPVLMLYNVVNKDRCGPLVIEWGTLLHIGLCSLALSSDTIRNAFPQVEPLKYCPKRRKQETMHKVTCIGEIFLVKESMRGRNQKFQWERGSNNFENHLGPTRHSKSVAWNSNRGLGYAW